MANKFGLTDNEQILRNFMRKIGTHDYHELVAKDVTRERLEKEYAWLKSDWGKYICEEGDIDTSKIMRILAHQLLNQMNSYEVTYDGTTKVVECGDMSEYAFFYTVSKRISFSDCTDESIDNIIWHGKRIKYAGWQPKEKFEYKDLDGNTVWVGYFDEFDH